MSEGDGPKNTETGVSPEKITKHSMRKNVWDKLQNENLVNFPWRCWGRIPNIKGAEDACARLVELDVYKNAQVVKVNPDKPQESVRVAVLKDDKTLVVPIPRLRKGLLTLVTLENDADDKKDGSDKGLTLREMVGRKGIEERGKPVPLDSGIKIDLVVVGSVAVSTDGHRIGKGEGFADLEYAMMMRMKAVNQDTVIATTVHDVQVFDSIPKELFKPHDIPVDVICTPTRTIIVNKKLPKPTGIDWSILSQRRLDLMPILQQLWEADKENGKNVELKEEESDIETQQMYRPRYRIRPRRKRGITSATADSNTESQQNDNGAGGENIPLPRPRKTYRRKKRSARPRSKDNEQTDGNEKSSDQQAPTTSTKKRDKPRRNKFHKNRNTIDFSLRVGNIEKSARVRDLKAALAERGVKPSDITWRGLGGYCYLHFSKPTTKDNSSGDVENGSDPSIGVDKIIESLQDLKLSPDSENSLLIEPAKPISRIETTDVTAV